MTAQERSRLVKVRRTMAWAVIATQVVLVLACVWVLVVDVATPTALLAGAIWAATIAVSVPTLRRLLDPSFGQR